MKDGRSLDPCSPGRLDSVATGGGGIVIKRFVGGGVMRVWWGGWRMEAEERENELVK